MFSQKNKDLISVIKVDFANFLHQTYQISGLLVRLGRSPRPALQLEL